jgi:elongation factor G
MANKQRHEDPGVGVAVDHPSRVRNVVLVGPPGSGKTTLVEALLAATGTIDRAGSVGDGTTTTDHDPVAIRQQRSVALAVAPLVHAGVKVNLIDTPGFADFVGEQRAGLRAADAALFVVGAADGVDPATASLWQECAVVGMPRVLVVSRLDHPRAAAEEAMAACRRAFGDGVLPLYTVLPGDAGLAPILTGEGDDRTSELIEGIIGESEDEDLMERYLAGESVDEETLVVDLEKAVAHGAFHPAIPVCAGTGVGLPELLDVLVRALPSPVEHPLPAVTTPGGAPVPPISADPAGPLVAEVVQTSVDAYVGRVSIVRVFSGTLRPDTPVHVSGHGLADRGHADHDIDERVGHVFSPLGAALREVPYCVAGDIAALTKIRGAETGDTLSLPERPVLMTPWVMPEPLLPVAVVARTRSDEDALAKSLGRVVAADPTLRMERNPETHQLVLWCMGESHADVVLSRLRAGGADIGTEPFRVPLRATFAAAGSGHGRHVKQSGGHGQYAVCDVEVEPLERGAGVEFTHRVVGGAVPAQYIVSVEKGVRAQLAAGLGEHVGEGAPVVDVRVTLVDGKTHSVDSSDAAFQTAGALAVKAAAAKAGVIVLEPVDEVTVVVPDEYLGGVLADLSGRRGRVHGTEPGPPGRTLVRVEVPAGELVRYAVDLRALSAGSATFQRRFAHYEPAAERQLAR